MAQSRRRHLYEQDNNNKQGIWKRKEELKLKHQKTMRAIEERRQAAERKRLRGAQRNVEHRFIQSTNISREKDKKDG